MNDMDYKQLQNFYKNVEKRLTDGYHGYQQFFKVLRKRVDAEEKIAKILRDIKTKKPEKTDEFLENYLMVHEKCCEFHTIFSGRISELLREHDGNLKAELGLKNEIEKELKKNIKVLDNAVKEMNTCYQDVVREKERLKANPWGSDKKLKEFEIKHKNKVAACGAFVSSQNNGYAKTLKTQIDNFEKQRVEFTKEIMSRYSEIEAQLSKDLWGSMKYLNQKIQLIGGTCVDPNNDGKLFCIALYDYKSLQEQDLQFSAGEIIQVLDQDKSGWWLGRLGDKTGYFPSNYVQIEEVQAKDYYVGCTFVVTKDNDSPGQLEVGYGDCVFVESVSPSFSEAYNLRTGNRGVVPTSCLETRFADGRDGVYRSIYGQKPSYPSFLPSNNAANQKAFKTTVPQANFNNNNMSRLIPPSQMDNNPSNPGLNTSAIPPNGSKPVQNTQYTYAQNNIHQYHSTQPNLNNMPYHQNFASNQHNYTNHLNSTNGGNYARMNPPMQVNNNPQGTGFNTGFNSQNNLMSGQNSQQKYFSNNPQQSNMIHPNTNNVPQYWSMYPPNQHNLMNPPSQMNPPGPQQMHPHVPMNALNNQRMIPPSQMNISGVPQMQAQNQMKFQQMNQHMNVAGTQQINPPPQSNSKQ